MANGDEFDSDYLKYISIPSYEDTLTRNPIRFSEYGGYTFAHTYIEFLDKTYEWEKVLQIIETEDYENVFGKTQRELYDEWVIYIRNYKVKSGVFQFPCEWILALT